MIKKEDLKVGQRVLLKPGCEGTVMYVNLDACSAGVKRDDDSRGSGKNSTWELTCCELESGEIGWNNGINRLACIPIDTAKGKAKKVNQPIVVAGNTPYVYIQIGCKNIAYTPDIHTRIARFRRLLAMKCTDAKISYEGDRVTVEDLDNLTKYLKSLGL